MKILVENRQKKSQVFNYVPSVSSISSTVQDILLQRSTDLKMEGRKIFT